MVSFRTTLLALASAVAVAGDYYVEPNTVPLSQRKAWCNDQRSTCPTICLQTTTGEPRDNSCDPETLTYGCVCSDGKQPNMTMYTLTLPYYVCLEWGTQCERDCGTNNICASSCRQDHPCGAQDPPRANKTTTTASAATSTATTAPTDQVYNGLADGGSGDSNRNAAGVLRFGDSYGLVVMAAGLFAGFAAVL